MINCFKFILFFWLVTPLIAVAKPIDIKVLYLKKLQSVVINNDASSPESPVIAVNNSEAFKSALSIANKNGNTKIKLKPGLYTLDKPLVINAPNIHIYGESSQPFSTVISGQGMKQTAGVDNLINVNASGFSLHGVTLKNVGNHLVQIRGEFGASNITIKNVVFQDSYEQLLKSSSNSKNLSVTSDNVVIENCLFWYSKGIGPNWYIGGIDAHVAHNWRINNNVFANIASPGKHIAEHAIHLWNNSQNNTVEDNVILNSDRGIGFGMRKGPWSGKLNAQGGKIKGNVIYHDKVKEHPYADVGIIVEDTIDTQIVGNVILLNHHYPNAIELRFKPTTGIWVEGNISNKRFTLRGGSQGVFNGNVTNEKLTKDLIKSYLD
ncbi:right-handed parallel beta-helix repeat-containing protein [Thalassotalea eurytherma]|uniref:Right handed beta helix domain-containing protein n=1 Tax=Thalassotalea eurytherma TaxID=1144278 RepID=A0ABQ6H1M5_9GAMM|nr:right-handed parallel beta-helix repeat-containing protein [Thalassotalea eurytherma]GLX82091.1 hypothetical protein theurythT_15430 [Thalassotalea eurytherma]